jgi:hypothetical protein
MMWTAGFLPAINFVLVELLAEHGAGIEGTQMLVGRLEYPNIDGLAYSAVYDRDYY